MGTIWTVCLLGGLSLRREGSEATRLKLNKRNLLLARLAFELGGDVGKYDLIDMLWPDLPEDNGRHSLAVELSLLRGTLEPPGAASGSVLQSDNLRVWLNSEAVSTDLNRLRAEIGAAQGAVNPDGYVLQMQRAIDMYTGELLPRADNAWVAIERENTTIWFLSEVRIFAAKLIAANRIDEALQYALRCTALSPLDDVHHELVIELLLRLKRVDEACRYFVNLSARLISTEQRIPGPAILRLMAPYQQRLKRMGAKIGAASGESSNLASPHPTASTYAIGGTAGIPAYLNDFFGREHELLLLENILCPAEQIRIDLLGPGAVRLATITGLGGCGKTRLAAEAAGRLAIAFEGHILFIPLGGAARQDDVIHYLGRALQLSSGAQASVDDIISKLQSYPWLVVLDNCERVSSCRRVVKELLQGCPLLRVLSTSRVPLRVAGEQLINIEPFAVPHAVTSCRAICEFPSAQLFVRRAQAANADFAATDQNARDIAAIVERLEGLPLAIELVAAHARTLSPSQMLSELVHHFNILVVPAVHDRGHTLLKHTIDWSYRHLTVKGKRFFGMLSVFRDGFTIDAVRDVSEAHDAVTLIDELTSHSLITAGQVGEVIRYSMLDSLREHAFGRLKPADHPALEARHAAHYLGLLATVVPRLGTRDQPEALAVLDCEHPNVRAAIEFSRGTANEVRFAAAAWRYWYARAHIDLGAGLIERALKVEARDLPEYAEALHGYGAFLEIQDDLAGAETALNESLALTRGVSDRSRAHARTLNSLALLQDKRCDHARARETSREAVAIVRECGDQWDTATCLNTLGRACWHAGDPIAAEICFLEALSLFENLEDWPNAAVLRFNTGCIDLDRGDLPAARTAFEIGLEQFREMNQPMWVAAAMHNLGDVVARQGDEEAAKQYLFEALAIRHGIGDHSGVAATIETLAEIAHIERDTKFAVRLTSGAHSVRERYGVPIVPGKRAAYAGRIQSYRDALSEIDYESAWLFGSELSLEVLVLYARERRLLPTSS